MSDNSTIEWTSFSKLRWSDFQAESNPAVFEDSHSVIKYGFTWIVNSDKINGDDIVFLIDKISLFVEFHSLLSWVRQSQDTDHLLNHEQGCFDLAELVKRENLPVLEDKFYNKQFPTRGQNNEQRKQFAKEDSGKMIHEEVEKLQCVFDERLLQYRNDTDFGNNAESQSKYDLIFKKLRS